MTQLTSLLPEPGLPGPSSWTRARVRYGRLAVAACLGLAVWITPRPETVDPRAWQLLAVFVGTVVGIILQPLPIGAMAFLGLAAALASRTLTIAEALSGFASATVWLVVAAFFLAGGFIRTGLGVRIACILVSLFGRTTLGLGYSLVASDLVLAPMIPSNTARAGGVIFPILQSLTRTVAGGPSAPDRQTRVFLTLAAYNGTVITSAMFVTAMVANPLVVQLASSQGVAISWTGWAIAAAVPGAVSLAVVPAIIYGLCARGARPHGDAPRAARASLQRLGPMRREERMMAAVAIILLGSWIVGSSIGLDPTAAALMAVAVLMLAGVLGWEDLAREAEAWNTYVWFAVLVTMATYLGQFGLTAWFTDEVRGAFVGIHWLAGFLGVVLVYFYSHYFFASITAHVSAMYAPFLAVCLALGTPPLLAALVLGFSSNLFASLTHYGTAPAPILFASGHVTLGDWWRIGAIVSVVNIAIWVGIGAAWWKVLGLW